MSGIKMSPAGIFTQKIPADYRPGDDMHNLYRE